MDAISFGLVEMRHIWYALPLIVAISLVYAATRHEAMGSILKHAMGCGMWIAGLMVLVLVLLFFVSWWV